MRSLRKTSLMSVAVSLACLLLFALALSARGASQAPSPPQAPPIPRDFNPYALTPQEAAAFSSVSADIRAGRYRDEDLMWDDLRRRTGSGPASIRLRNQLVLLSNRGELPTLDAWAYRIEQMVGPGGATQPTSPRTTKSRRCDGGFCSNACTCGCNSGLPCDCGVSTSMRQTISAEQSQTLVDVRDILAARLAEKRAGISPSPVQTPGYYQDAPQAIYGSPGRYLPRTGILRGRKGGGGGTCSPSG